MSTPRLWYHPLSSYSRKVVSALAYRQDTVTLRVIDVFGGEVASTDYRRLSPFGRMPVLETDNGPIIESTSIIEWFEDRGPRVLLREEHALIARRFDRLGDLYLCDPTTTLWWRSESSDAGPARGTVERAWELFANQLACRAFVAGDLFSLGDIGGAIATDYLMRLGLVPPPAIASWVQRCFLIPAMAEKLAEALPFVQQTLPQPRS